MRQTGQGEEGIVCRGAVVTYAEIADEMNCKKCSVREWMQRLIREKYIRVERQRRGLLVFVCNPKKVRVSEKATKSKVECRESQLRVSETQHSKPIHAVENKATSEKLLRNDLTKLPNNNNTDAAANCAAGVSSLSLSQTLEAMQRQTQEKSSCLWKTKEARAEAYEALKQDMESRKKATA